MSTIVSMRAGPELIQRRRKQIARQQRRRSAQGPRPWAALGYLVHGPVIDGLVDLRRLIFVALQDEYRLDRQLTTQVAGFASSIVSWGVKIGGLEQNRFANDLNRPPALGAKGRRFDVAYPEMLSLALDMDRLLSRHVQFPHMPRRRQPRWPALWAAFAPQSVPTLRGDGPEFEALALCRGNSTPDLLRTNSRVIGDLVAFPLAYVSHAWQQFRAIYADLKTLPKRQVITLDHQAKNPCGYSGAIAYDLVNTRFAAAPTLTGQPSHRYGPS